MNEALRRTWPVVLVTIVALLYLWVGVAAHGWDRVWGLAGGLAILAAVALGRRYFAAAVAVLLLGALPLAVVTWWSVATPGAGSPGPGAGPLGDPKRPPHQPLC